MTALAHRLVALRANSSIAERWVRPPTAATYTEQQQRMGRPLSPHVTIYKQPLSAISSITNRISGTALALGCGGLGAFAATGGDVSTLVWTTLHTTPGATPLVRFLVAYPLTYHWMNAARHQFWDWKPEYINLTFAAHTSSAIFLAALLVSGVASVTTLTGPVRAPPTDAKAL